MPENWFLMKKEKKEEFKKITLIVLIALISYGLCLKLFFTRDDFALLFKLQHPMESMGNFGAGYFGSGPYKHAVTFFYPFYSIFKLNSTGYFFLGLITFVISTLVFYYFAKEIFKEKMAAFFAALIYSAGYIGSESFFRLTTNVQMSVCLTLAISSFLFLLKHFKTKKLIYYFFSVFLFYFSIELIFTRSHSLIFGIVALFVLFLPLAFRLKNILEFGIKLSPFVYIFSKYYGIGQTQSTPDGVFNTIRNIFHGHFEAIISTLAGVGNVFIPDVFLNKFLAIFKNNSQFILLLILLIVSFLLLRLIGAKKRYYYFAIAIIVISYLTNLYFISLNFSWYQGGLTALSGLTGLNFLLLFIILAISLFKKHANFSKIFIFSIIFILTQVFAYDLIYKTTILGTTHRYLTLSTIGLALLLGSISYFFYLKYSRNIKNYTLIVLIVSSLVILNIHQQIIYIKTRTLPSEKFYSDLKRLLPVIKTGNTIFIDTSDYLIPELDSFFGVGSMPESTAIAAMYKIGRYDFDLTFDQNEVYSLTLKKGDIDTLNTFYYGIKGLEDTTAQYRNFLKSKSLPQPFAVNQTSALTYFELSFTVTNQLDNNISYPYSSSGLKSADWEFENKLRAIDYYLSRENYYQNVKVTSLSNWPGKPIEFISDNNSETAWWGHRLTWGDKKHEDLILDLGAVKEVSQIIWTNGHPTYTPTAYTIYTSTDKIIWKKVYEVNDGKERKINERVIDKIGKQEARYLKIIISKTASNDSPMISEIEVIDSKFDNLDLGKAYQFFENPFSFVENKNQMQTLITNTSPLLKLQIKVLTSKGYISKMIPLERLNSINNYSVIFDPFGPKIKNIEISAPNLPLVIAQQKIMVKNLNLSETDSKNLIKNLKANY